MHIHEQNHWNRVLFYWYQSYHWYQWRLFLSPLTPMESICEYWTTLKKKGLKIPFPRLSQYAFKRIQFCDLYSFSPAFLAAMKFVSNRSEIDKCNQVTGLQMIYKFLFQELHIIRPCQRVSRRKNVSLKLLSCPLHSD